MNMYTRITYILEITNKFNWAVKNSKMEKRLDEVLRKAMENV